MSDLRSFNLSAGYFLLITALSSGFTRNHFQDYIHGHVKPDAAPLLNQPSNTERTGINEKSSSPLLNQLNPNSVESIDNIVFEYQPAPQIPVKEHIGSNHNDKQNISEPKNKEVNVTITSRSEFIKNKDIKNKESNNEETGDINLETAFEYAEGVTDYDADMSTTEDNTFEDRFAAEVVASLLG